MADTQKEQKEKPGIGFREVVSPGYVDVTDDDPEMLQRVTQETGTELEITQDKNGRRTAKITAIVVDPNAKKKA